MKALKDLKKPKPTQQPLPPNPHPPYKKTQQNNQIQTTTKTKTLPKPFKLFLEGYWAVYASFLFASWKTFRGSIWDTIF